MKTKYLLIPVIFFLTTACGGGGKSSSSGSSGTTVTSESLKSLSSVPQINLEVLDLASATNMSSNVSALVKGQVKGEDPRNFSFEGCGLYSCVEEFKRHFLEFQSAFCVMREAEEEETGFEVGDGDYNYFRVAFDEEIVGSDEDFEDFEEEAAAQSSSFSIEERIRCGVLDENGTDTLRCMLCSNENDPGTDNFQQKMAMMYQVVSGKFVGQITNRFPDVYGEGQDDFMRASINGVEVDTLADLKNGDKLTLTNEMNSPWGSGSIALNLHKASDSVFNEVEATFQSGDADSFWGTWTSFVYGQYNSTEGCSKTQESGTQPAMQVKEAFYGTDLDILTTAGFTADDQFCWVEPEELTGEEEITSFIELSTDGTCSFTYGNAEDPACFWFEVVAGDLKSWQLGTDNATFFADVDAHTLNTTFTAPDISFTSAETWDCEAEGEFTDIDPSALASAFETCFAVDDAQDEGDINSCYSQFNEEEVGEFDPVDSCEGIEEGDALTEDSIQKICDCHYLDENACCYLKSACQNIDSVQNVRECVDVVLFDYQFGCYGQPSPEAEFSPENVGGLESCWGINPESSSCPDISTTCEGSFDMIGCVDILFGYSQQADYYDEVVFDCEGKNGLMRSAAVTPENVDLLCDCLFADGETSGRNDVACYDVHGKANEEGVADIGEVFDRWQGEGQFDSQEMAPEDFGSCEECVAECLNGGYGTQEECESYCPACNVVE